MVELQSTWNYLIVIYLFFGGLGAGTFLTASVLRLRYPGKFKKTILVSVWIAVASLAIGLFSLVSEVEKPFQAMMLWQTFVNFSSWMTIGAWLILLTFVIFAISAIFTTDKLCDWLAKTFKPLSKLFTVKRESVNKACAIIGIPCSIALAAYTGVLLGAAPAIPLWGTWLLPVLFTVSALDTGVAAVSLSATLLEKEEGIHRVHLNLEKVVVILVVLELAVLAALIVTMKGAGVTEALAIGLFTEGALSVQFWLLVVVIGLGFPLLAAIIQLATSKKATNIGKAVPVAGAVGALVGGCALRAVILSAGIHAVLMSPDVLQSAQGLFFLIS